jgi:hypothetical protein
VTRRPAPAANPPSTHPVRKGHALHDQPAQHNHPDPADRPGAGHLLAVTPGADRDTVPVDSADGGRPRDDNESATGRAETTHGSSETTPPGSLAGLSQHSRRTTPAGAGAAGTEPSGAVIPLPRQPVDAGPVAGSDATGSGVLDGGWQVARVETAPMSGEEFSAAVSALAALITEWNQRPTDSSEKPRKAA